MADVEPDLKGTTAVDVQIGWSVDTTFDKLWGPGSEFSAHVREARNIGEYQEGPWVRDDKLFQSLLDGDQDRTPTTPRKFERAADYEGYGRKVSFSQPGTGGVLRSTFHNEELQRCVEAVEGDHYLMHCCVATNAPYGDRVRIVLEYSLSAAESPDGSPACNLRVSYVPVYIRPTNGVLRNMIKAGIDSGVRKNFSTLRDLLAELVDVRDNEPEGRAAEPTAHEAAARP
eukprot:CAMPEP_0177584130 /NCGR_PEP_ID=MMETSP0419_2-20121207/3724_1 /TAXON_ID=582737 /ORGANISM="Tetraselmis sp., Strain GSL018" /LENGTH=228 /DNA_ID=CAMNT_0019073633 /DNA_START=181 /DNA_END=865 /DNA_ORIENTATION=+